MPRPSSGSGRNSKPPQSKSLGDRWREFNESLEERRADAAFEPEYIEPGKRVTALGIDFGVGYFLSLFLMLIPFLNLLLSTQLIIVLYLLIRDYFFEGRGIGKNLMGIQVVDIYSGNSPSLKQVIIRNGFYLGPVLACMLYLSLTTLFLPLVNPLLPVAAISVLTTITTGLSQLLNLVATVYLFVIVPVESYRSYEREDSMRLGDEIAGTCLANSDMSFSNFLSK